MNMLRTWTVVFRTALHDVTPFFPPQLPARTFGCSFAFAFVFAIQFVFVFVFDVFPTATSYSYFWLLICIRKIITIYNISIIANTMGIIIIITRPYALRSYIA